MSLFAYEILLADGKEKSGKITAKTEDEARKRLAAENKIVEWHSIQEVATAKAAPAPLKVSLQKPVKAAIATKLEKLLYLQSSKCFFCGQVLTKAEASVEHLMATSKGGTNSDDNVVACCATLNRVFGNIDLKAKVRIILEKAGNFQCPKS